MELATFNKEIEMRFDLGKFHTSQYYTAVDPKHKSRRVGEPGGNAEGNAGGKGNFKVGHATLGQR